MPSTPGPSTPEQLAAAVSPWIAPVAVGAAGAFMLLGYLMLAAAARENDERLRQSGRVVIGHAVVAAPIGLLFSVVINRLLARADVPVEPAPQAAWWVLTGGAAAVVLAGSLALREFILTRHN